VQWLPCRSLAGLGRTVWDVQPTSGPVPLSGFRTSAPNPKRAGDHSPRASQPNGAVLALIIVIC
jgi:hypothetical protein